MTTRATVLETCTQRGDRDRSNDRNFLAGNPEVEFVGKRAMVPTKVLDQIGTYQTSMPTSPSPGRCYKRRYGDRWFLFVVELDDGHGNPNRPYEVIEMKDQAGYQGFKTDSGDRPAEQKEQSP